MISVKFTKVLLVGLYIFYIYTGTARSFQLLDFSLVL